jgi:hypothetical protein
MKQGGFYWEVDVFEREPLDVSGIAQKEGIAMRVLIDGPLADNLKPNQFLEDMGISQTERIKNLVGLLKVHLAGETTDAKHNEKRCYIPFMIVKGPYVREEFLPVLAVIRHEDTEKPVITLSELVTHDERE